MKTKILIVVANYYLKISKGLCLAATKTLEKESNSRIKFKTIETTGVFEIPIIVSKKIKNYDAIVALGCVIKGETPHFDYISRATIDSLMRLSVENKKPIGNGILTCLNISQASARSEVSLLKRGIKKNKGREAARAVLSVLGILKNGSK